MAKNKIPKVQILLATRYIRDLRPLFTESQKNTDFMQEGINRLKEALEHYDSFQGNYIWNSDFGSFYLTLQNKHINHKEISLSNRYYGQILFPNTPDKFLSEVENHSVSIMVDDNNGKSLVGKITKSTERKPRFFIQGIERAEGADGTIILQETEELISKGSYQLDKGED